MDERQRQECCIEWLRVADERVPVPIAVPLSLKVTEPVGVPFVLDVTLAVKVHLFPAVVLVEDACRVVMSGQLFRPVMYRSERVAGNRSGVVGVSYIGSRNRVLSRCQRCGCEHG